MTKYHIRDDGTPAICKAVVADCPIGGEHFDCPEKATNHFEEKMKNSGKSFKVLNKGKRKKNHARTQMIKKVERKVRITEPHNPKAKYSVLSDVDGTLTKGSLVLDHAVYLHEKGIVDLGDLPEKWLKDKKNEELITELAVAYRDSIAGKSKEEIKTKEFIDDYAENDKNFFTTLNELKTFQERGWEVRLVSGSPNFLVEPFAEKYGFFAKGSEYGTDENGKFNGEVEGMFGYDQKKTYVAKLGLNRFKRILAYGDTGSDAALVEASHHSTMVNPTDETREKVKSSRILVEE